MKKQLSRSVLTYLRLLARQALKQHKPTVIGVAGSVGKSSTRFAISATLKDKFRVTTVGNSESGIPLGIVGVTPKGYTKRDWAAMLLRAPLGLNFLKNYQYLVAEMGIDEPDPPKNMEYLLSIVKPDIAVVLNESATHSQQFDKTLSTKRADERSEGARLLDRREKALSEEEKRNHVVQNIAIEDCKIITESNCRIGIYNADDIFINKAIEQWDNKSNATSLRTFGKKNKNDVSYGIYSVGLEGSNFQFFVEEGGQNHELKLKMKDIIVPLAYREVFAAAILVGIATGVQLETIKKSLQTNFSLPKGRSSLLKGIKNSIIIDSSYNASKQSVLTFLDLLDKLENTTDRPTSFLFGDMRELGSETQIEHEEVAKRIVGTVDHLYLVGPQTRKYVLPVIQEHEKTFKEVRWFDTSVRAGEYLQTNLPADTILLVKGSQNTIFLEEAVKRLLENKNDAEKLCRQSEYWQRVKEQASQNLSQ